MIHQKMLVNVSNVLNKTNSSAIGQRLISRFYWRQFIHLPFQCWPSLLQACFQQFARQSARSLAIPTVVFPTAHRRCRTETLRRRCCPNTITTLLLLLLLLTYDASFIALFTLGNRANGRFGAVFRFAKECTWMMHVRSKKKATALLVNRLRQLVLSVCSGPLGRRLAAFKPPYAKPNY
ncbi:hypothetical protein Tsp_06029 [Trichinella spiralis]|uniref:hypothetical protein n=1 Tax=Trichinella spiralis TaxID=6334 RepID=UPI0001EFCFD6|nr:hypothetical protein Tsp_06029 [Trichinella spiralis]